MYKNAPILPLTVFIPKSVKQQLRTPLIMRWKAEESYSKVLKQECIVLIRCELVK